MDTIVTQPLAAPTALPTDAESHPLALCFPSMTDADYAELLADVKLNGVRDPVTTLKGLILDGHHRAKAAREAGQDCPCIEYHGDDPVGFVISRNAARRHLTQQARATAVIRARKRAEGRCKRQNGDTDQPDPDEEHQLPSVRELSQQAGVGHGTAQRALQKAKGVPLGTPDRRIGDDTHATIHVDDDQSVEQPEPMPEIEAIGLKLEVAHRTISGQFEEITRLKDDNQFLRDQANPESAVREQVLNNQRQEIRTLKQQVAEWQRKYDDARREAAALRRQLGRAA